MSFFFSVFINCCLFFEIVLHLAPKVLKDPHLPAQQVIKYVSADSFLAQVLNSKRKNSISIGFIRGGGG